MANDSQELILEHLCKIRAELSMLREGQENIRPEILSIKNTYITSTAMLCAEDRGT